MTVLEPLQVRCHGAAGPVVVLLHGGPGAPGYLAPLGRELAAGFCVLEPLQRRSGRVRLTVAQHVDDLQQVLQLHAAGTRPALVGSSWGAMLALAHAAAFPAQAGPLVLVGCGTFDPVARAHLQATLAARTDAALQARLDRLPAELPDADARLRRAAELTLPLYARDLVTTDLELLDCDARGHAETWEDMLRRQADGTYPAAFSAITAPVLMLHGDFDPHPGGLIRDGLRAVLPHLEYRAWADCGHYPWLERAVRAEFLDVLRGWLRLHAGG